MATLAWRKEKTIKAGLEQNVKDFDFHVAVQLIEAQNPKATPLGEGSDPSQEALSIKSNLSLSMPTSEVEAVDITGIKPVMQVNFVSIAGRQGPLPTPYTETAIERARMRDTGFRDFLDIFNHRLASLWYRFRKKVMPGLALKPPHDSPLGLSATNLAGLNNHTMLKGTTLKPNFFISAQQLLWQNTHSTMGLKRLLESYFKASVSIKEFQGGWNVAQESDISRIAYKKGQYNVLGKSMVIGNKSWNQSANIVVHLGPLSWAHYNQLVPLSNDKTGFMHLRDICYLYLNIHTKISVVLYLNSMEVQFVRLNRKFSLGLNTWLKTDEVSKVQASVNLSLPRPFY